MRPNAKFISFWVLSVAKLIFLSLSISTRLKQRLRLGWSVKHELFLVFFVKQFRHISPFSLMCRFRAQIVGDLDCRKFYTLYIGITLVLSVIILALQIIWTPVWACMLSCWSHVDSTWPRWLRGGYRLEDAINELSCGDWIRHGSFAFQAIRFLKRKSPCYVKSSGDRRRGRSSTLDIFVHVLILSCSCSCSPFANVNCCLAAVWSHPACRTCSRPRNTLSSQAQEELFRCYCVNKFACSVEIPLLCRCIKFLSANVS